MQRSPIQQLLQSSSLGRPNNSGAFRLAEIGTLNLEEQKSVFVKVKFSENKAKENE